MIAHRRTVRSAGAGTAPGRTDLSFRRGRWAVDAVQASEDYSSIADTAKYVRRAPRVKKHDKSCIVALTHDSREEWL